MIMSDRVLTVNIIELYCDIIIAGGDFMKRYNFTTVVPFHGEDLGRGLIRKILKDIEISPDEYEELRKRI